MDTIKIIDKLALILLIVGGLNWGLIGILSINLVAKLFGEGTTLSQVIYSLIGISALYLIINYKKCCKK